MSIIEVLRRRELETLKRSDAYSSVRSQRTHDHAKHVKQVLSGETISPEVPVSIQVLRDTYYNMLRSYQGNDYSYPTEMNKQSINLWTRVETARSKAGCLADKYIKAQFAWFHKKFGKAPTVEQLSTPGAVERALEFSGSTTGRVVGNNIIHKNSLAETFKQNEVLLQSMMKAQQCTRVEFYKRFVITGIYSFDTRFLEADPAYQKALNG
jgi:hypothetical protein